MDRTGKKFKNNLPFSFFISSSTQVLKFNFYVTTFALFHQHMVNCDSRRQTMSRTLTQRAKILHGGLNQLPPWPTSPKYSPWNWVKSHCHKRIHLHVYFSTSALAASALKIITKCEKGLSSNIFWLLRSTTRRVIFWCEYSY